ncbi:MAG: segregation and condensation protein A [Bacillota bacterium]
MEYEIQVGDFQGPLDLLYKLVKKNKIEISEISLANITEQYLYHLKELKKFNLDMASEFMVLATELLEIKAKLLLPENNIDEDDENDNNLVQRLEEYELFKNISVELELYLDKASRSFRLPPEKELIKGKGKLNIDCSLNDFRDMYKKAIKAKKERKNKEEREDAHYSEMDHINTNRLSVEDKTLDINNIIKNNPEGVKFRDLINDKKDILEIVVTLLGLLELVRLNRVEVYQDKLFSEMEIIDRR